ncbi:MAG TPA: pentapeptide repeat-containing protein [Pseudonocardiaceae bacterium]
MTAPNLNYGSRLEEAQFTGAARFIQVQFTGDTRFNETQFSSVARFGGARFTGATRFGGAQFAHEVPTQVARFLPRGSALERDQSQS